MDSRRRRSDGGGMTERQRIFGAEHRGKQRTHAR